MWPTQGLQTLVPTSSLSQKRNLRQDAHRFEIGNFNLPAIHALGGALDLINSIGIENVANHVLNLGDELIKVCDELDIELVGPRERDCRSHIYVLDLTESEWPDFFKAENIRLSPVRDGIRVSFGIYNTSEDVARLGAALRKGLQKIKRKAA
ncbi:aminotransferase class V-fold PLP-dependent enzyme [Pseudomonas corrugata]